MDALDLQIVRTMGVVPFGSWPHSPDALKPSYIASQVSVTVDRVQDRVRAMEQAGIITGYDVHPNPRTFGVMETTFHFRAPAEGKRQALDRIWELEGVFGLYDYVGEHACVQMFFRDTADRDAKLREVARTAQLETLPASYMDRPYPKPPRALTPLESRILRTLRGRARAPPAEIAEDVGVSVRTLRRKLETLAAGGFYDVYVWFDFGAAGGRIPVELNVHFPRRLQKEIGKRVLELVQEDLLYWWQPPAAELGTMELLVMPVSTARVEALRRAVMDLPGVERVDALIPSESRYSGDWLDDLVAETPEAARLPAAEP